MTTNDRPRIYFSAPIRATGGNRARLITIGECLREYGELVNPHVIDTVHHARDKKRAPRIIHDRDLDDLGRSDILVAEVSVPSLGIGYEIGRLAERCHSDARCLPMLALYFGKKDEFSAMIAGSPHVTVGCYRSINGVTRHISSFFQRNGYKRL